MATSSAWFFALMGLLLTTAGVAQSPLDDQITNTLFNNIFSSFTTSLNGFPPVVDPRTSYIQFALIGTPIDPNSFNNTLSLINPNGDLIQSQYFSRLVNSNPFVTDIEAAYSSIIHSARPLPDTDPSKQAMYDKAYNYLKVTVTTTNPFTGENTTTINDSPVYAAYKKALVNYHLALSNYRTIFDGLNMANPADQRKWLEEEPLLSSDLDNAYDDYRAVAPIVEDALDALNSLGQSLATTTISKCNTVFQQTELPSALPEFANFHMSFSQPSDWATNNAQYTNVHITSSNLHQTITNSFSSWAVGGGFAGFVSWGADGTRTSTQRHSDTTHIQIDCLLTLVQIDRPWLLDSLFKIGGWKLPGQPKGSVSQGVMSNVQHELLPSYPTHMIVVKNLTITGDWSSSDIDFVETRASGGARVGWGPFSISGGRFSYQQSTQDITAKVNGQKITVPGAQVIAWINTIVPYTPQLDG